MDKQKLNLNDHQEVLKDLNKLEKKLQVIFDFYEELGILRQRRKHLVETLMHNDRTEPQQVKETLKKQVIFNQDDLPEGRRLTKIGGHLEIKKSVAQVYDLLGNLSSYHAEVNKKISELQLLKSQKKSDPESLEIDTILAQFQEERDEIDNKIIQFVIKDVVQGKDELFNVISILEEVNKEMEDTINLLEGRAHFLKDTITALMLENQLLKKGETRHSDIIRKSIVENVSLLLPLLPLRISSLSCERSPGSNDQFYPEQDDIRSVDRSTLDSFTLDAALALWATDKASIQEQVKRIGRDFEVMEVNHMKLNLLKQYVQRHGAKYINGETFIDPSKGLAPWKSM